MLDSTALPLLPTERTILRLHHLRLLFNYHARRMQSIVHHFFQMDAIPVANDATNTYHIAEVMQMALNAMLTAMKDMDTNVASAIWLQGLKFDLRSQVTVLAGAGEILLEIMQEREETQSSLPIEIEREIKAVQWIVEAFARAL